MPTTVVARLQVPDPNAWLAEYESMHAVRASFGERGHIAYRDLSDPSAIVAIFQWDEEANARRYFGSGELAASVGRAEGGQPELLYLEAF